MNYVTSIKGLHFLNKLIVNLECPDQSHSILMTGENVSCPRGTMLETLHLFILFVESYATSFQTCIKIYIYIRPTI